jgi:hypothetical protein
MFFEEPKQDACIQGSSNAKQALRAVVQAFELSKHLRREPCVGS